MNYDTCKKELDKMAKSIIAMEKSFDSSMRGVLLDMLVTNYVQEQAIDIVSMYEYIVSQQTNEYDNYGDIDTSVTKAIVTGKINTYPEYVATATGIILRDIFSDNNFVIVKVIEDHKTIDRFRKIYYHVRKIHKEITKINYNQHVKYGDLRDDGYVVSLESKYSMDFEIEVKDGRGMAYRYKQFKEFVDAIRQPYLELKENEK